MQLLLQSRCRKLAALCRRLLGPVRRAAEANSEMMKTQSDCLRDEGMRIGAGCHIGPDVVFDYSHIWLVAVGNEVTFAPRVHIIAHDASTKRHLGLTRIGKVTIGNKVFIGASSIVLPGVTIGENSIIGAGSVVSQSIPADCVAAGNPAKVVCSLESYLEKRRLEISNCPTYGRDYTALDGISTEKKNQMLAEMHPFGYVV